MLAPVEVTHDKTSVTL